MRLPASSSVSTLLNIASSSVNNQISPSLQRARHDLEATHTQAVGAQAGFVQMNRRRKHIIVLDLTSEVDLGTEHPAQRQEEERIQCGYLITRRRTIVGSLISRVPTHYQIPKIYRHLYKSQSSCKGNESFREPVMRRGFMALAGK